MSGSTLTGLDYWRLSDELSVIDVCFLVINSDPGFYELKNPDFPATSLIQKIGNFSDDEHRAIYNGEEEDIFLSPAQFRAVFKALRNAILSNKLRAKICRNGRNPSYVYISEYDNHVMAPPHDDEDTLNYQFLVQRGVPTLFTNSDALSVASNRNPKEAVLYLLKEPDWQYTTVELDDLKGWFEERGIAPAFFFPTGLRDGFRSSSNPRYSPKLATAIAAWEKIKESRPNKSVKQSLTDWIVSNGVSYGLGNEEGVVSPTVAEEVAKIANWQTAGGATKTHAGEIGDSEKEQPIQNFKLMKDDSEIPF